MAGLAFGAAGAAIGGPLGYLVGSTVGNLLFPAKGPDGPRLTDLRIQGSSYGVMLRRVYGTARYACQVIDETDLTEHAHATSSKGGPTSTNYTYTASFMIALSEGPIETVRRVWRDGELAYSTVVGEVLAQSDPLPVVFYLGTHDQDVDPTFEALRGVGNIPAYRGTALAVLTDLDVTRDGNRAPNLEFEIVQNAGPIPWRVSTFTPTLNPAVGVRGITYDPSTGVITIADYIGHFEAPWTWSRRSYLLDGTPTGTPADAVLPEELPVTFVCANADIAFCDHTFEADSNAFIVAGVVVRRDVPNPFGGLLQDSARGNMAVITGPDGTDWLFAVGISTDTNTPGVARWTLTDGIPGGYGPSVSYPGISASNINFVISDDGNVWVTIDNEVGANDLYEYDIDLNPLYHWSNDDSPAMSAPDGLSGGYAHGIYKGILLAHKPSSGIEHAAAYRINADHTFTFLGQTDQLLGTTTPLKDSSGLFIGIDGIISVNPQAEKVTLASIVSAESLLAGLVATEFDVSELTDVVDGYSIEAIGSGRDAIAPLQQAFFFDGVESDGLIKFPKRGGNPVATIADADLAAFEDGSDPPGDLATERTPDNELARLVTVSYPNPDADYQTGTQIAQRTSVDSVVETALDMHIVMTDAKAAEVAATTLFQDWLNREHYTASLTRKWLKLDPADVILLKQRQVRIHSKTDGASGVLRLEGFETMPELYSRASVAGTATGFVRRVLPPPTALPAPTFTMLDIPLVKDTDAASGFYVASARTATLYKSLDDGATFTSIGEVAACSAMGTATSVLLDAPTENDVDERAVTVLLSFGTLASAPLSSVLNGANMALLGDEIIQFCDAELIAANTYQLSRLLRGRRGTEFAAWSHASGDRFILLPVADVASSISEVGQPRVYKAVPAGQSLSTTTAQTFTNKGARLRPYSPVHVGGGPNNSGDIVFHWTRRTRVGGTWVDYVDVPVSETSEQYTVSFWDSTFSQCAHSFTGFYGGVPTPIFGYTAAEQVADFGALQSEVYVTIAQVGVLGAGTPVFATISGAGSGVNAPLFPVLPPGAPPPSSGGCTLPVTTASINWSGETIYNHGFAPGEEWVIHFTTGAITAGVGQLVLAEYGSEQVTRHGVLSNAPCGAPLASNSQQTGKTLTFTFFMTGNPYPTIYPTLLPFTTYYLSVETTLASSMYCIMIPPNGG